MTEQPRNPPPPGILRIALAQVEDDADPTAIIAEAASNSAEVIVFPEMFSNGYRSFDTSDPNAEALWVSESVDPDGPWVGGFRQAAIDNTMYVVATFLERASPAPFNTALLIGPDGNALLLQRKVHTCFFDQPESACGRGTGVEPATISTRSGAVTVGIMICMDREYPEIARSLAKAGAEVILVPNACDLVSDPLVGDVRVAQTRGRAFESTVGIAVANYPAPRMDGGSFAVDAQGRILVIGGSEPGIVYADIDIQAIRDQRTQDWFRLKDALESKKADAA